MSRTNEGGMHFVSYHRKNKEFDNDTAFAIRNKNKPKQFDDIIYHNGKRYRVIDVDEEGNKTVVPCKREQKKDKGQ